MPLYIGDFLADTMHLGATERGIYISLIMHAWQHNGAIPLDDRKLSKISGCDARLWHLYRQTALQFFDVVDASTAQHPRVVKELHRSAEISNKRKAAALQMHSKKDANAEQVHTHSQPHLQREERKDSCAVAPATRTGAEEAFNEFWKVYPRRDGANPKAPARKLFLATVKSGTEAGAIVEGARQCAVRDREKIGTPFIPQAVKWLRDRRWEDYAQPVEGAASGWRPGMPTSEELRAKYARRMDDADESKAARSDDPSEGAANGASHPPELFREGDDLRTAEQLRVLGEVRQRGVRSLGQVLSRTLKLDPPVHPASQIGSDDDPGTVA